MYLNVQKLFNHVEGFFKRYLLSFNIFVMVFRLQNQNELVFFLFSLPQSNSHPIWAKPFSSEMWIRIVSHSDICPSRRFQDKIGLNQTMQPFLLLEQWYDIFFVSTDPPAITMQGQTAKIIINIQVTCLPIVSNFLSGLQLVLERKPQKSLTLTKRGLNGKDRKVNDIGYRVINRI